MVEDLAFAWEVLEGEGSLSAHTDQEIEFQGSVTQGLVRLKVAVSQRGVTVAAEALITVTDSLEAAMNPAVVNARGLPG